MTTTPESNKLVRARPILFSAPMARALLDGRKTQTRRLHGRFNVGDVLYVQETWRVHGQYDNLRPSLIFDAMGGDVAGCVDYMATPRPEGFWGRTRVSIFMPRWATRILLEVTGKKSEPLCAISEEDAIAEGAHRKIWITSPLSAGAANARGERGTHQEGFREIWEGIHGPNTWALNPRLFAYTFRRCDEKLPASLPVCLPAESSSA